MQEIVEREATLSDPKIIGPKVLVRTFVESLRPATHKAYLYSLEAFRKWAGYRDLPELANRLCAMTGAEADLALLKYTKSLEGRTPSTVNARTQGIRSLVKLARMLGLISWSLEVQQVKVERYRDARGPGTTIQWLACCLIIRNCPLCAPPMMSTPSSKWFPSAVMRASRKNCVY